MKKRKCLSCLVDISLLHWNSIRCKPCAILEKNRWKDSDRNAYFFRKFGITLEQYNTILAEQDGVCAICSRTPEEIGDGRYLAIDHDHITQQVRGLLCRPCNTGIGLLGDSVQGLKRALNYLENRN